MTSNAIELQARIEADAYDYDAYRELIPLLPDPKQKYELRKRFHSVFPLDESLWNDWLMDLVANPNVCSDGSDRLFWFEQSLKDYLSPKLHVMRCKYVISIASSIEDARTVLKDSAGKCGAHFTQGHVIWNLWIEFEQSKGTADEVEYPMRRRATLPLQRLDEYWTEYCGHFPQESTLHKSAYESAREQVQERLPFEQAIQSARDGVEELAGSPISAANAELERQWIAYIDKEKKLHPKRKNTILYERAVADCCLSVPLWTRYLIEMELGSDNNVHDVCARALRNCFSSSGAIWSSFVRTEYQAGGLERSEQALVKAKLALQSSPAAYELGDGLLSYCAQVKHSNPSDLPKAFTDSLLYIKSIPEGDEQKQCLARLLLFQSRCYFALGKHEDRIKSWEDLHRLFPLSTLYWMEHVKQEEYINPQAGVRELYNRALHNLSSQHEGFDQVSKALLDFELLYHSNQDWLRTKAAVEAKRRPIKRLNVVVAPPPAAALATKKEKQDKRKKQPREEEDEAMDTVMDNTDDTTTRKKRPLHETTKKPTIEAVDEIPARKIREKASSPLVDIVFVPSLPDTATSESVLDFFSRLVKVPGVTVGRIRMKQRQSQTNPATGQTLTKQYAFVEFTGEDPVMRNKAAVQACKFSGSEMDGVPLQILLSKPPPARTEHFKKTRRDEEDDSGDVHMKPVQETVPTKPKTLMVPRAVKVAQKKG